jgi:hypothetical protein
MVSGVTAIAADTSAGLYGPELLRYVETVGSSRLLILVVVLATACGQARATSSSTPPASTHSSGPRPAVALAGYAARTARAGSARLAIQMHMSGPPGTGTIAIDGTGVVAFRARVADMRMHMVSPTGAAVSMREIMRWPVLYMRSPVFASVTRAHRPWVKLDMAGVERAHGIDLNALEGAGSGDPAQMLSTLEGESDSIAVVGHEVLRGVRTTHYHALIDLSEVARSAPPALRVAARRSERRLAAMLGRHRMAMDVWIGADGRVRRVAYRMSVTDPATGAVTTTDVRMDMFAFGVPVHVTAPPAARTTDITSAVAAAGGSG